MQSILGKKCIVLSHLRECNNELHNVYLVHQDQGYIYQELSLISQLFLLDTNEINWRANGDISVVLLLLRCFPEKNNLVISLKRLEKHFSNSALVQNRCRPSIPTKSQEKQLEYCTIQHYSKVYDSTFQLVICLFFVDSYTMGFSQSLQFSCSLRWPGST